MLLRRHCFNSSRTLVNRRLQQDRDVNREYRRYVAAVGTQIGELAPVSGETVQEIAVKVKRAARAMGWRARTWIDEGKVYFFVLRDISRGV